VPIPSQLITGNLLKINDQPSSKNSFEDIPRKARFCSPRKTIYGKSFFGRGEIECLSFMSLSRKSCRGIRLTFVRSGVSGKKMKPYTATGKVTKKSIFKTGVSGTSSSIQGHGARNTYYEKPSPASDAVQSVHPLVDG
jgi:hypothetical protein